jgi:hypothetical protein
VRAGVIVTGVLGAGSALVFALAIAVSAMFPNGGSIASNFNQVFMNGARGGAIAMPVAVPAPTWIIVPASGNNGGGSAIESPTN